MEFAFQMLITHYFGFLVQTPRMLGSGQSIVSKSRHPSHLREDDKLLSEFPSESGTELRWRTLP